ncbi:MAG: tetratricopeptide repeat protein, partial [Bacteroidota bacterium]
AWFSASWFSSRADLMMSLGRHGDALELFLEAEERRARVTPDDFTNHVYGAGAAEALQRLGRTEEALAKLREARDGMRITRAPRAAQRNATRSMITLLAELGLDAEHDRELANLLRPPGLPLALFRDGQEMPYSPSGVMGEVEKVRHDLFSTDTPYEGQTCFKWHVDPGETWAAIAWLEPENDWGERPGGYDLTGAKEITFVARGAQGGETLVIGMGIVDAGAYPDTLRERVGIELTRQWQRFTFSLEGSDLSTVRAGFVIESKLTDDAQTVYFDDIRVE